jgi:hypothetical protein
VSDTNNPEGPQGEGTAPEINLAGRILILQQEHRALDQEIEQLYGHPYRDQLHLQRLKKKKLLIKDMITRFKDDLIPDLNA